MREFQRKRRRKRLLLKRAIDADPKFAMAYATSAARMPTRGPTRGRECSQATSCGTCQRLGKLFHYFHVPPAVNQKPGTLSTDLRIVGAKYPMTSTPRFLSGFASPGTGHHNRAVEEVKRQSNRSGFRDRLRNVAFAFLYLNACQTPRVASQAAERKSIVQFSLVDTSSLSSGTTSSNGKR